MKNKKLLLITLLVAMAALLSGCDDNSFKDSRDGQRYKTVKIGKQVWMAENLNMDLAGSHCYEDKPDNCSKYGRLYNKLASKIACPENWHLPSADEFQELLDYAASVAGSEDAPDVEAVLKSSTGWNEDNNGTDKLGFNALPADKDDYEKQVARFWSKGSRYLQLDEYVIILAFEGKEDEAVVPRASLASWGDSYDKSIRCIKDKEE